MLPPRTRMAVLLLIPLVGCAAWDPHMTGPAPHYAADLDGCRASSREQVRLENAKTVLSWMGSPLYGPGMVRAAIRQCMEGKGYALAAR